MSIYNTIVTSHCIFPKLRYLHLLNVFRSVLSSPLQDPIRWTSSTLLWYCNSDHWIIFHIYFLESPRFLTQIFVSTEIWSVSARGRRYQLCRPQIGSYFSRNTYTIARKCTFTNLISAVNRRRFSRQNLLSRFTGRILQTRNLIIFVSVSIPFLRFKKIKMENSRMYIKKIKKHFTVRYLFWRLLRTLFVSVIMYVI